MKQGLRFTLSRQKRRDLTALLVAVVVVAIAVLVGKTAFHIVHEARTKNRPLPARALTYTPYIDSRWKLTVEIPAEFTQDTAGSQPDFASFSSDDGQAHVKIWSAPSKRGLTPRLALDTCKRNAAAAHETVTFVYTTSQLYVCRGNGPKGAVFYERGVIGASRSYYLRWDYTARVRNIYGPAVDHSVDTYVPGPLGQITGG